MSESPLAMRDFSTSLSGADWERLGTQGHEVRIGDARRLERLHQSAYACEVLSRLLILSGSADGAAEGHPLNDNVEGGLHYALNVIAESMQADLSALGARTDPQTSVGKA